MSLEFPKFTVHLYALDDPQDDPENPATVAHQVVVNFQDQLNAERELQRLGMTMKGAPLNTSAVWCWAALMRTNRYAGPVQRFLANDCAGVEHDEDDPTEAVDPTQQGTPVGSP